MGSGAPWEMLRFCSGLYHGDHEQLLCGPGCTQTCAMTTGHTGFPLEFHFPIPCV